jgi:peptide/nickel transport system permease protein
MRRRLQNVNMGTLLGGLIVAVVVLAALLAPVIAPYDPNTTNLRARNSPPSSAHLFGTDSLGRDLASRVIWGARVSLRVGIIAVVVGMSFGVTFGLLAGYFGGRVDDVINAAMDFLLAFPAILLAIAIVAALGPGLNQVMVAVGIAILPNFARVTRSAVMSIRTSDYVLAALALGASHGRVIVQHVLPNTLTPIVVLATLNAAFAIIMEAGLSFLGIGVQPPDATWGSILSDGRAAIQNAPWITLSAGIAISLTVLGLNLLGDGIRDLTDPRTARTIRGSTART